VQACQHDLVLLVRKVMSATPVELCLHFAAPPSKW
jgi:hypothetical protein